jgi:hypothetical protein
LLAKHIRALVGPEQLIAVQTLDESEVADVVGQIVEVLSAVPQTIPIGMRLALSAGAMPSSEFLARANANWLVLQELVASNRRMPLQNIC